MKTKTEDIIIYIFTLIGFICLGTAIMLSIYTLSTIDAQRHIIKNQQEQIWDCVDKLPKEEIKYLYCPLELDGSIIQSKCLTEVKK